MSTPCLGASDSNPDSDIALVTSQSILREDVIYSMSPHLTSVQPLKPFCEWSLSVAPGAGTLTEVWQ